MTKRNEKLGLKKRHGHRSSRDQHTVKKRDDDYTPRGKKERKKYLKTKPHRTKTDRRNGNPD